MSADDPFVGEIIAWGGNFAPVGWLPCDGRLLPIFQNQALFSLLGTTYGGDGQTNFALPDLRGRAGMDTGAGNGLTPRVLGEIEGSETVTLNTGQLAAHAHTLQAATVGDAPVPTGRAPAPSRVTDPSYGDGTLGVTPMAAGALSTVGSSQPHENLQPFLAVDFIIAYQGIFPSQ